MKDDMVGGRVGENGIELKQREFETQSDQIWQNFSTLMKSLKSQAIIEGLVR